MSVAQPIRVATAALSERIFAGRPTKDGRGFKEPRYDVTSDVLLAIRDKVGIGNVVDVAPEGGPAEFRIAVLPAEDDRQSAIAELCEGLEGFVVSLTGSLRNRETMLTINHDELVRRIEHARALLSKHQFHRDGAAPNKAASVNT